jgi:hypothetical protein
MEIPVYSIRDRIVRCAMEPRGEAEPKPYVSSGLVHMDIWMILTGILLYIITHMVNAIVRTGLSGTVVGVL